MDPYGANKCLINERFKDKRPIVQIAKTPEFACFIHVPTSMHAVDTNLVIKSTE